MKQEDASKTFLFSLATLILCMYGIYLGYYQDIGKKTIVDVIVLPIFVIHLSYLFPIAFQRIRKMMNRRPS